MFGFVSFAHPETVKVVLARGNPHFICDSRVLVKPYKEKGKALDKYVAFFPLCSLSYLCFNVSFIVNEVITGSIIICYSSRLSLGTTPHVPVHLGLILESSLTSNLVSILCLLLIFAFVVN